MRKCKCILSMEHTKLQPRNWLTSTLLGNAICKDSLKTFILTSSVDEAGSRMIRVNIDAFRQIGDRRIHFKAKVTLILCVFSGSDVGSK